MKIVRVTYTAKADYAAHNKENIGKVMATLRAMGRGDINYHVCLGADGQTFTHLAFFENEEAEQVLLTLPEFKAFQQELKASGPEVSPRQEFLTLVGSNKDIF